MNEQSVWFKGKMQDGHSEIPNEVKKYPGSSKNIFIGSRISSASPFGLRRSRPG